MKIKPQVSHWLRVITLKWGPKEAKIAAAESLGKSGAPRAVRPLVRALSDRGVDHRLLWTCVQALAAIRNHDAVQALHDLLLRGYDDTFLWIGDEDRKIAVQALGETGCPEAVCIFEKLLLRLSVDRQVRAAAAKGLGRIGGDIAVRALVRTLEGRLVWRASAYGDDKTSLSGWVVERTREAEVRVTAAESLGQLGDAQGIAPLVACLSDQRGDIRKAAAKALQNLRWEPTNEDERALVAVASGRYDEAVGEGVAALDPLLRALRDESLGIQQAAAKALGELGDPRAVEALALKVKHPLRCWERRDEVELVTSEAAKALARIGPPQAEDLIIVGRRDISDGAAIEALATLGLPRVAPLLAHESSSVRRDAVMACRKIGGASVPPLIATLRDEHDAHVIAKIVEVLGEMGDRRAVQPLVDVLFRVRETNLKVPAAGLGPDVPIARVVIDVLAALGDKRAMGALIDSLQDENVSVRCHAAEALGKIGDAAAVEALTSLLTEEEPFWEYAYSPRRSATRALRQIGDSRAVELLIGVLTGLGTYGKTREEAADALAELGDERTIAPLVETGFGYLALKKYGKAAVVPTVKSCLAFIRNEGEKAHSLLTWVLGTWASEVPNQELHTIAALDRMYDSKENWADELVRYEIDCSELRRLAREELARRANAHPGDGR